MKKNKTTHVMATVFMLVFIAVFLVITGRFLYIQGTGEVEGISLQQWADEKRTNSYTVKAERGKILDRNGMVLAYDRATYRLSAVVDESYSEGLEAPKHVKDIKETAEKLSPLLNMDVSEITSILEEGREKDLFQVEFGANGKELSQETKEEIEALDLPGINFTQQTKRYYPNGMFASHIIGLAQSGEEGISGMNGIERQLNDVLSGTDGHISYKRDNYNTKLLNPDEVVKKADNGEDVFLTIDQKIQTLLEDSMSEVQEQYNPERISAIVMDPKTGEILAMGNRPSYNPNDLGEVQNWYNDAVSNPFEPGSTMKIFTLAAAIEEGVFNPDEFYQSGKYQNDDMNTAIHDHKPSGWGSISFLEGIQRSSNVAAAKLVYEKIGADKFLDYLKDFDFDKKTGIDLPNEQAGRILYDWPIEKVTASYGQGTTVTLIQQMQAASAIANNGQMLQPYVISKVVDSESGEVLEEKQPETKGKPVSEETAKEVRDILETVITSENGTGHGIYDLNDYSVAGKTGTAQIPNPNGGGYMTGSENHIFSFLGMAPKEDPQLMMIVSVKQPELKVGEHGSAPVSFIFKNVMENGLHYLNIEPDQDSEHEVKTINIPDVESMSSKKAKQELESLGLQVTQIGKGKEVKSVSGDADHEFLPNERVLLVTDEPTMPDISGWSVRDVLRLADLLKLDVETMGNGFAKKQSIKVGTALKGEEYLVVEFSPPSSSGVREKDEKPDSDQEEQNETVE
ncbi:penicillin-binding protein [Sediminibacillus massiliensis]|uniref:penicillin-binding protein n=1 Tax=Sediminibacillus massiliensis TaxID=1926277 RepID=UPI0009884115|nr:penicillin-binding protein [Sediminibacillus massiliensis]